MKRKILSLPVLAVFVVIFGGILFMATRPWLPGREPARKMTIGEAIVTAENPFQLEWPRRREGVAAPHLSLRIPHTAFARGPGSDRVRLERLMESGNVMYLFTAFQDDLLAVTVMQDMPERSSPGYAVMDSKERGTFETESSGPKRDVDVFWVNDDGKTGRLDFVGWDCQGTPPSGTVSTDVARPIAERNRCFEPPADERGAPSKHYQRFARATACAGDGTRCAVYFPFRGRHVEVAAMRSPMGLQQGESSRSAFLAAWEFLNRLHADAVSPP